MVEISTNIAPQKIRNWLNERFSNAHAHEYMPLHPSQEQGPQDDTRAPKAWAKKSEAILGRQNGTF